MNGASMLERLTSALEKSNLLSDWERDFVESLGQQWKQRSSLSRRQIEILERIEAQKLSASALRAKKTWNDNYDEKKRHIATVCAHYYKGSGYFTDLALSVLHSPKFVPTEKQWKKMCQNKYARKVLAEYDRPPTFGDGSLVELRSTAPYPLRAIALGVPCVVISSSGYIATAAKGSKPYKVLPFGSASVLKCEERHLKKCKNPTKSKKILDNDVPF